ncbi:hypothetical protein PHET_08207 [Paragonimus heterotremus]|uniref:Uncharacterized protein n=1 Tax=Paragonimus heterotremus TaxID=100268 RepID=A0A8J4STW9_9TREM|nr:hypothetical protein PHET_08207 [Paragonimus heterotremus]
MSQQAEDLTTTKNSIGYSTVSIASANSPVGQLYKDRGLEVELAKLRIQEADKRIELERTIQQQTTLNRDGYKREPLGVLNKSSAETPAFSRDTAHHTDLSRREIQRFDDSSKSYWSFTKAFESGVDNSITDNQDKLDYLIQYFEGPAKSSIQRCTILEEDRGCLVAEGIPRKRFGQNHSVVIAHIDEHLDGLLPAENDFS